LRRCGGACCWVGCIAGALQDYEYVAKLARAGFDGIDIEPTRVHNIEDWRAFLNSRGVGSPLPSSAEDVSRGSRIESTSMGGACFIGSKSARWRTRENRPSAPIVRRALTSIFCHSDPM